MNKAIFVSAIVVGLILTTPFVVAHKDGEGQAVTLEKLGVLDPGILPGSPFYFLKELGRSVKLFFTFGEINKIRLQLRITNEKAAEAKTVENQDSNNLTAIEGAIKNYKEAQERLVVRLESLRNKSGNPNIDKLIDEVVARTAIHSDLFDDLKEEFLDKESIQNILREVKDNIDASIERIRNKDGSEGSCVVGGCSSELCVKIGEEIFSTCEYKEEYSCYKKYSTCELQPGGNCGWTSNEGLSQCIERSNKPSVPLKIEKD